MSPPREVELLDPATRMRERLMLGLRLESPLPLAEVAAAVDGHALTRLVRLGLVERSGVLLRLAPGRFLGGAVTVELLEESLQTTTI